MLTSCRILIEGNIRIYDYKRLGIIHKRKDQLSYDFFTIIRGLKRKIQDYTQSDSIYKKHEFNIGKTTRIWNLGPSGYDKSYLYSYRYIQAYEYVGFPIGLTDLTINNIDFRYVIPYYLKYNVYALLILIRLNNTNIVKKCVSRAVLKGISVEQACAFFDIYYPNILKYLNNKSNPVYVRTGSVLLPLFSRLSTRLTRDRIINFFKFYVKYYIDDRRFYNKDDLSIIYGCLANDDLHNIINLVYSQPINICGDDDVLFPQYDYNSYTINNDALGIIERGLRNRDINISNSAYRRLILIYKNLSGNDKEIIDKAIYEWRNTDELSINKKYSLRILPYNKHIDRFDIETIVKDEVLKFVTVKKILNFDSLPIQNLIHDIESLCSFNEYLSVSDYEKIIISITSFLKENKDVISKDDSDSIFGGMRNFTNQLYEKILRFIKNIKDWKAINNKIVDDLIAIFIDLGSYHLKYLSVVSFICPYSSKYKERSFIQKIEDSLFSGDYVMRADAINALIIMAENNISIQGLVKKIITCIELTQGESTSSYIELLIKLFLINKIGKDALKEIPKLLNSLFIGIQNNPVTDEYKTDIYYSSNKLAGVISVIISPLTTTAEMTKSIQLWKDFSNDKSTFNDVKIGFENGCLLVKHWK